ncbi:MAG: Serine phosphatase RsbU, regulator of sigma subunit [uncultured Solirubrobacteraceae bacterium]|uniref:Serine phosphatase RsbU, regulator of sigma subunit n=1 Tax=uncultured Solirubrobacteraceae bacterium TaxID=1162706 RepID=A0A6J4R6I8_9ACTN|nr:MAG: Serine phosphatase RsbU, regulator of sigma subunit [uncultured Solirubrobacteraceae bacterium]
MASEHLETRGRRRRSDAESNFARIVAAAGELLQLDPDTSVDEIAAAAAVSRATVYRHFRSRLELVAAARQHVREVTDANETDALRPPGELSSTGPVPLDVTEVLNKVPPHLLGDQIVSEARRLAGVTSVAAYLVDIDGTALLRLAGSEEFPQRIPLTLGVGPEIPREGLPPLRAHLAEELPGSVVAPMLLRGRAVGVLLAVDAPEARLAEIARQAGAALSLANGYTDVFDDVRRRKETSAAAEIQQNLLPPRIARIAGGLLAGNVLPGYDIGGDWFDYIENRDGAWLGIADSKGRGTTAAAIGGVALGAFRAKRRIGATMAEAMTGIDETIRALEVDGAFVNAVIGRWHGPSSTFRWITAGHQSPLLISGGEVIELGDDREYEALGLGAPGRTFEVSERRLKPEELLLLVSDGVLEREVAGGGHFGIDGVRALVADRTGPLRAPALVRELSDALMSASEDVLEDDATLVAFSPSSPE